MIMNGSCAELQGYPAKIKIGSQNFSNETLDSQFNAKFDVFQFTSSNETDYLDFSTNPRRIIPKYLQLLRVGNFLIPGNITRFMEYWKRSKFIDCVNITMDRVVEKPKLNPQFAIKALSLLRDIIVDHGMYPFLMEGTLLGWYRECNIIPHTHDMDLAIFASEYNPELLKSLQSSDVFDVTRVLGEMEDSFELTVDIKRVGGALTDIFLMYREDLGDRFTYDFIGGSDDANDRKLKFIFPKYDPWCAADLLGHIFWVTCSPDCMIPFEFGKEEWKHDYPSEKYSWCESQKNTMLNGKLRKTEEV